MINRLALQNFLFPQISQQFLIFSDGFQIKYYSMIYLLTLATCWFDFLQKQRFFLSQYIHRLKMRLLCTVNYVLVQIQVTELPNSNLIGNPRWPWQKARICNFAISQVSISSSNSKNGRISCQQDKTRATVLCAKQSVPPSAKRPYK